MPPGELRGSGWGRRKFAGFWLSATASLADGRSEPAYETVLRVFHVLCGFSVTPQYEVRDASGRVGARADLRIWDEPVG